MTPRKKKTSKPAKKATRKKPAKKVESGPPFLDGILHHKKRAFLLAYSQTFNVTTSAEIIGIERQTHYVWKWNDEKYAEAFHRAGELGAESFEDIAKARAAEKSDLLLIFLLKGAMPEKYRERFDINETNANLLAQLRQEVAPTQPGETPKSG
jgi:hypothetical protein